MTDEEKERLIRRFFERYPGISDAVLSLMLDVDLETVQQMRDSYNTENRKSELEIIKC